MAPKAKEKDADKGPRCQWDPPSQIDTLITFLLQKHREGAHDAGTFKKPVWTELASVLKGTKKAGTAVKDHKHCSAKYFTLQAEYKVVADLTGKSSAGWDETKFMVTFDDAFVWDKLIESNQKYKPFKNKGFPYYDAFKEITDGFLATGEHAFRPSAGGSGGAPPPAPTGKGGGKRSRPRGLTVVLSDKDDDDAGPTPAKKNSRNGSSSGAGRTSSVAGDDEDKSEHDWSEEDKPSVGKKRTRTSKFNTPTDRHGETIGNGLTELASAVQYAADAEVAVATSTASSRSPERRAKFTKIVGGIKDLSHDDYIVACEVLVQKHPDWVSTALSMTNVTFRNKYIRQKIDEAKAAAAKAAAANDDDGEFGGELAGGLDFDGGYTGWFDNQGLPGLLEANRRAILPNLPSDGM